jgi:hypothetical protein
MRQLTHKLDIAIRDSCIKIIEFQVKTHPSLVEKYLGHYLRLCEDFNNIESCTTIFDSITRNNITYIHDLSMIEFQSILAKWIKEKNNDMLKAIIQKNYFIESLGVCLNQLIILYSLKKENIEIFNYCTKHIQEGLEDKIMETVFNEDNFNMINYIFVNHFNIAIKVKDKFKDNSTYSKLLIKHKIVCF